jgi:hypothetical protein
MRHLLVGLSNSASAILVYLNVLRLATETDSFVPGVLLCDANQALVWATSAFDLWSACKRRKVPRRIPSFSSVSTSSSLFWGLFIKFFSSGRHEIR